MIDHAEGRGFCAGGDVVMLARERRRRRRARRAPSSTRNIGSTTCSSPTPSRPSPSWTGSRWAAASASRSPAATGSRPRIPASPCRRRRSACSPTSAAAGISRACRGRIGQFLALTGARLDGAECLALGLATHYMPSRALDEVKARIARAMPERIEAILRRGERRRRRRRGSTANLRADRPAASPPTATRRSSPRSRPTAPTGRGRSWRRCAPRARRPARSRCACSYDGADDVRISPTRCARNMRVASRVVQRHDFVEGVRALLVDKDNQPRWDPPTPEGGDRADDRHHLRAAAGRRGMDAAVMTRTVIPAKAGIPWRHASKPGRCRGSRLSPG